jgi:hypothetical protein
MYLLALQRARAWLFHTLQGRCVQQQSSHSPPQTWLSREIVSRPTSSLQVRCQRREISIAVPILNYQGSPKVCYKYNLRYIRNIEGR